MTEREGDGESPYTRLRDLAAYAFSKADYDDPNLPEAPKELKEFSVNTVLVMGGGLLFGGIRQWLKERKMPSPEIPAGYSKAERAKFLGEIKTRQMIRVLDSTLRGGFWCGWLGALYFGVETLSAYARQVRDPWNTVLAAWACGSVFGFAVGGPGAMARLRSASAAIFFSGLIGYPVGYVQLELNALINPELRNDSQKVTSSKSLDAKQKTDAPKKAEGTRKYPVRDYDVVQAVIGKLDRSLQDTNDRFK